MTDVAGHQGGTAIFATLLISLMLAATPLPALLEPLRPDFALLSVIYWCLALPDRVGIGIAWIVGLFQDVLMGTVLGQHAFSYALIALITLKLYQRVRLYPLWQQALAVLILLLLVRIIHLWIYNLTGHPPRGLGYWLPALSGAALWPAWYLLLRWTRRRFRVA